MVLAVLQRCGTAPPPRHKHGFTRWKRHLIEAALNKHGNVSDRCVVKLCRPPSSGSAHSELQRFHEALHANGVDLANILAGARSTWSGVEVAVEDLVYSGQGTVLANFERWSAAGALDRDDLVSLHAETRQTYGMDVGSKAPSYLDCDRRFTGTELATALAALHESGVVCVRGATAAADMIALRERLGIRCKESHLWTCPSDLPTSVVQRAIGDVEPEEPTTGRRHFLIRGTKFAENIVQPLLAPLLPLIFRFMAACRPDALPGCLLTDSAGKHSGKKPARLFLSECQLLITDCLGETQLWHRDNDQPGVTVVLPLTEVDEQIGPTQLLPRTHRLCTYTSGLLSALWRLERSSGVAAARLRPGDALIYDARILHRGLGNASFSRCRVVMVMRLDYTDTPPPGATVCGFMLENYLVQRIVGVGTGDSPLSMITTGS